MTDLLVHGAQRPLRGIVPAPPHRDLAQMAMVLASLSDGESTLSAKGLGALPIGDALRALGVHVEETTDGVSVRGLDLPSFVAPAAPIDLESSCAALGLIAGLVVALGRPATIRGSDGLARRHLHAVARVLRLRGGQLEGSLQPNEPGVVMWPLEIAERKARLSALQQHALQPDMQAEKLAALTSGLLAEDASVIVEPLVCGDLFVRLLRDVGVGIETAGAITRLSPLTEPLAPLSVDIPGDPDASLMLLAAGMAHDESHVGVRGMISQPSDASALAALRDALTIAPRATVAGQATADVHSSGHRPAGVVLEGESALSAGATLPTLAAWAAHARGESVIVSDDASGSRVALTLAAFGVPAHHRDGVLFVTGGALRRADDATRTIDHGGDGGVAMLGVILGLAAGGTTRIPNADCIVARFPRFVGSLRALGARIETS